MGSGQAWLAYATLLSLVLAAFAYLVDLVAVRGLDGLTVGDVAALVVVALLSLVLVARPYIAALILLAIPTKIAIAVTDFTPDEDFQTAHRRLVGEFAHRGEHVELLDVATGTCNSLIRHGWLSLDADFTAVDLSETMLLQGRQAMAARGVPAQLALADARPTAASVRRIRHRAELRSGERDDRSGPHGGRDGPRRQTGGCVAFFDEQLHSSASLVERLYFRFVLSAHNTVHHCPVELIGTELSDVRVNQVHRFYYLCTAVRAVA